MGDEYFQTQDYLNALASYQQAADQIAQTIQLGQTSTRPSASMQPLRLAIRRTWIQQSRPAARALAEARQDRAHLTSKIQALQRAPRCTAGDSRYYCGRALNLGLQERYADALSKLRGRSQRSIR
ncbi:MAG: hypothetical protein ACJ0RG_05895 [Candidatus Azotimanducaceae bacterium]